MERTITSEEEVRVHVNDVINEHGLEDIAESETGDKTKGPQ
jgi:hypothetical protein